MLTLSACHVLQPFELQVCGCPQAAIPHGGCKQSLGRQDDFAALLHLPEMVNLSLGRCRALHEQDFLVLGQLVQMTRLDLNGWVLPFSRLI